MESSSASYLSFINLNTVDSWSKFCQYNSQIEVYSWKYKMFKHFHLEQCTIHPFPSKLSGLMFVNGFVWHGLSGRQLTPWVHNKDERYDNPQEIHEDKIEPEIDGMAKLAVDVSISVFSVEVEHCSIQLTCGENRWRSGAETQNYTHSYEYVLNYNFNHLVHLGPAVQLCNQNYFDW